MLAGLVTQLRFWHEATVLSYAQILFTKHLLTGWIALGVTFLDLQMGLAGLCATLASNAFALLLKFNRDTIRTGHYGFNALLLGLALAYRYDLTGSLFFLILAGSLLALLVTISLTSLMSYYVQLPILSLPFVLVTHLTYLAASSAPALALHPKFLSVIGNVLPVQVPPMIEIFFRAVGAIFFMPSVEAGVLIFLSLLVVSRLLAMLAVMGYAVGLAVLFGLGVAPDVLNSGMFGVNLMLTAMVLGGVFVIPSPWSYILAGMGALLCTLMGLAGNVILGSSQLLLLTAPFIVTSLLVLYAMKFREPSTALQLVTFLPGTPEENLDFAIMQIKRFGNYGGVRFSFPFYGEWTVSQGAQGAHTHKGPWRYAWDFLVQDDAGHSFHHNGKQLKDYYAYQLPVLAPADGTVVEVVNGIEDNAVGFINTRENWGNKVVIQHAPQVYSVLAHFSPKSIQARVGALVRRGDYIGLCGNSGRSMEPHVHFQVQSRPDRFAHTLSPAFTRFLQRDPVGLALTLVQQSCPETGAHVKNLTADDRLVSALHFPIGKRFHFRVQTGTRTWEEEWVVSVDFSGTLFIESIPTGACAWIAINEGVFTVLSYLGSTETALFVFAIGVSLVPLTYTEQLVWRDVLPYRYFCPRILRGAIDVIRPLIDLVTVDSQLCFQQFVLHPVAEGYVEACSVANVITVKPVIGGWGRRTWTSVVVLAPTQGPLSMRLHAPNGTVKIEAQMLS